MKTIKDFVKHLKVLESNDRRKEEKEKGAKKKKKNYYLSRNKHKLLKSERRRTAEKLSLWEDIKEWRNKITKIPEVQRLLDNVYTMILYQDFLSSHKGSSIKLGRNENLTYESSGKFGFNASGFVLNDANIKRIPLELLKGFHNSIKSGAVYKKMLEYRL